MNMDILLIEDIRDVAQSIGEVMRQWGHDVVLAETGKAAVRSAAGRPFDLALLDIMLPDGFGYDFIPEIREHLPRVNIVTLTGYSSPELERAVRAHGIAYYMANRSISER
jgi:DNA-binding response OmpR family regulator